MVVYLHESLDHCQQSGQPLTKADLEAAVIEAAVQRLHPKLMSAVNV